MKWSELRKSKVRRRILFLERYIPRVCIVSFGIIHTISMLLRSGKNETNKRQKLL